MCPWRRRGKLREELEGRALEGRRQIWKESKARGCFILRRPSEGLELYAEGNGEETLMVLTQSNP